MITLSQLTLSLIGLYALISFGVLSFTLGKALLLYLRNPEPDASPTYLTGRKRR